MKRSKANLLAREIAAAWVRSNIEGGCVREAMRTRVARFADKAVREVELELIAACERWTADQDDSGEKE